KVRGCLGRLNAFISEMIGGMRTVRAFGQEEPVFGHFSKLNTETQGAWRQTVLFFALFFAIVDLVLRWSNAGLLLVGGSGILSGTVTIGIFVQFFLYFGKLTEPIKALGEKYNVLQSAFASCERIFKILGETPMPLESANPIESQPGPASLAFQQVDFSYLPDSPVLHGVDFVVEPGSTCAIVGPTGAGKSTILSLVSRMYDPNDGQVLLDGESLRELSLRSLRRRIAVVQQDVFLFSGTVLDNVRLLDESTTEDRVRQALEMVGALEFVEALPGGLHAEVQERGAKFSQGERQLLSFARALATDPDILLLDEATANVDSDSEARIQRALGQVISGRTCLVVAHRLSTVRDADQILVMQAGRIAERGDHQQLLARGGIYAGMIKGLG
ncbi:MAG: ABC transporter ATP-binding protein, partial [Planctomycetota bacterium]